ncbi:MAG: stage II sporulation protein R [Oscillospiraceae bacterium]|nr:stage II sporulation protein R [Oscillospiraceae bacterium]
MKLKIWELSICVALVIAVLWGALLERRQTELAEQLIRLHVVAHSDEVADQDLKLRVRDSVQAVTEPLLVGATNRAEAEAELTAHLPLIRAAAAEAVADWGGNYPVQAAFVWERHPARAYESFTLPAGRYYALRVEIGAAAGQNWWCVVFPPLCLEAAGGSESLEAMGLSEDEVALIAGGDRGHTVRFRVLEVVDGVRAWFGR